MTPWVVHKFGGTSVANAARYRDVTSIIQSDPAPRKGVVVSAMSGVTNALIELVDLARRQSDSYLAKLEALKSRHFETLSHLFPKGNPRLRAALDLDFTHIKEVLRGIWLARSCTELTVELISGYGEIWSAQFLSDHLNEIGLPARWMDAREVLVVEPQPMSVVIDWETSRHRLTEWLGRNPCDLVVITGFIASTREGMSTTLKRNGSDYSASIFGALLNAGAITIWTDVDGVLSADPRLVPEAVVLDELSYNEATELAYFGAKVVHPSTMGPAIRQNIPVWIRNTFRPQLPGTVIHAQVKSGTLVKGFATIDKMALVNVEGTGMIGVPGVAQRLFGALREVGVSVVMISQASSEHSICFAVPQTQAEITRSAIKEAFFSELHHGLIQTVAITENCTVLAVVGDNMADRPGVAAKFFNALGKASVNIRAIAQGSSERNISAVVEGHEATRALRAVHAAFYLSHQTVSIGVIGAGLIGGTFLDQLHRQSDRLRKDFKIDLRVRGILNSKRMYLGEPAIDLGSWKGALEGSLLKPDREAFLNHIHAEHLPHTVIIDATASGDLPKHYQDWFQRGIHVITPNKKGNSASMESYRRLIDAARDKGRHYLYATTVGAGLPIINTLRDLVKTGDQILRIEGVLSGTLSYLFNSFSGEKGFSTIVQEARAKGYTEPDPRDDLSGMDVARKLVILAREMGVPLELPEIEVENLVAVEGRQGSVDEFLRLLPQQDAEMERRRAEASRNQEVLRYVGVVQPGGKSVVQLRRYGKDHPFAGLTHSDNMVVFTTSRYRTQPLIIRGPGAGPEVTAAGVFSDLLRLTSYLGGAS